LSSFPHPWKSKAWFLLLIPVLVMVYPDQMFELLGFFFLGTLFILLLVLIIALTSWALKQGLWVLLPIWLGRRRWHH
jgi:hypothetical protein